jgi:hypothetical protein
LPGQSGRTQPAGKTQPSPRLISRFVPRGLPLARSSVHKTYPIRRNRKSTLKNTFPRTSPKTTKLKPFRRVCWSKITNKGGTRSSYVTSNKNPQRNTPKTSPRKFQGKAPKITKKGKREEHEKALRNHAESSIHTIKVHTRSSFCPIILPSHKISP